MIDLEKFLAKSTKKTDAETKQPAKDKVKSTPAMRPEPSAEIQDVLSKLPEEVIELIHLTGAGAYPSRSERDMRVLALLKAYGVSIDQAQAIFRNSPCGDKYREHGNPDQYLKSTYDKARPVKVGQFYSSQKRFIVKDFIEQFIKALPSPMLYRDLSFYRYEGRHYVAVESDDIKKKLYEFLGNELSDDRLRGCLNLLKTRLTNDQVKTSEGMLNFRNGVLNLVEKELVPHTPEWFFTMVYPFDYDPQADCPRYKEFLERILGSDKDILLLDQEWLGYMLSFSTDMQKFRVNIGCGCNGKSTHLQVMKAIVGEGNYCDGVLEMMWSGREAHRLLGKKAFFCEELNYLTQVNAARLKESIDGMIHANPKYESPFSFRNLAKMTINTNEIPPSSDSSLGMSRRMIIIEYNHIIPEKEKNPNYFHDKLEPELSGIMNYALAGYDRVKSNKRFTDCVSANRAVHQFMLESSPVKYFVDELCIVGKGQMVIKQALFRRFLQFMEECNFKSSYSLIRFSRELMAHGRQIGVDIRSSEQAQGGYRQKVYGGIDLK